MFPLWKETGSESIYIGNLEIHSVYKDQMDDGFRYWDK